MKLWIEGYGETKFYGLYDSDKISEIPWGGLVAVFVYKRGAENVKRMLEELEGKWRNSQRRSNGL